MKPDLRYYLSVLLRRLHYVGLIFLTVTALSVYFALNLPPVYQSTARLLMESAKIPDALAAPTVQTAEMEQLQVIEQQLMTRTNLLEIARKFNAVARIDAMAPDDIVSAMRQATTIHKQAGRDQATMLTITFDAESAQIAAAVVNEYVTRVLTGNAAARTSQAQDTLQFFQQEVERLSAELSTQSARILAFQNQNADALPNTLTYRLTEQTNLQERLASVQRESAGLKDQRQRLIEIFRSTGQLDASRPVPQTPEAAQLAALEIELSSARAVLAPDHPKVVMLETRVADLQARITDKAAAAGPSVDDGSEGGTDAPMTLLEIQIAEIDSQIAQMTQESTDISRQLTALKELIDRSAGVAVQLEALNRDYANLQAQYDTATDRLSEASTGERIAVMSKGQRIGVLDAATVPDTPSRPNRFRIVVFGAGLGMILGLGLVGLLEMLNTSVRRPIDLERHLNITPIGTIPYIRTPGEILRQRLTMVFLFLFIGASIPAMAWLIDTYYMPLDQFLAKINKRLGF